MGLDLDSGVEELKLERGPYIQGNWLGQKGSIQVCWRVKQLICDSLNNSKNHIAHRQSMSWPRQVHGSTGVHGDQELEHGDWRATPRQRLLLTVRRCLKECEGRNLPEGMLLEENSWPEKQGSTAESHAGVGAPLQSLSPHTPALAAA